MAARERSMEQLDAEQMKKGSVRHAVRKIFHRSSKITALDSPDRRPSPNSPRTSSKSSASPISRTPVRSPNKETNPDYVQDFTPYQTLSATMHVRSNDPGRSKGRSPNAVEFPHSAKLKPLNLGNPFANPPEPRLRRRKTLPTALQRDTHVKIPNANYMIPSPQPSTESRFSHALSGHSDGAGTPGTYDAHRRSRSAENLKAVLQSNSVHRTETDGARPQKPGLNHPVLRASGFVSREATTKKETPDHVSGISLTEEPELARPTPRRMSTESTDDVYSMSEATPPEIARSRSPSAAPPITSDGLTERVSRLETSMVRFQQSLESVSAEQEKRAVTARNLEKTLHDHFIMNNGIRNRSNYNASPLSNPPDGYLNVSLQVDTDLANQQDPKDLALSREGMIQPTSVRQHHKPSLSVGKSSPVGEYTFRSLYEMLVDERSARRRLEQQVKILRQELLELRQQTAIQHSFVTQHVVGDGKAMRTSPSAFATHQPHEVYYDAPGESMPSPRKFRPQPASPSHASARNVFHEAQITADADKFYFDIASEKSHDLRSESSDEEMF